MYKKRSKKPIYIAATVTGILIVITIAISVYQTRRQNTSAEPETTAETETETETPVHNILLYKNSSGSVEFNTEWVKSDTDTDSVLEVAENTLVTMQITPVQGKVLESVDVLDYDFAPISTVLRAVDDDTGTGAMRLSFVMPERDIIVNFNFTDIETEAETGYEEAAEPGTEATEAAQAMPYGLKIHNLTANIIMSYNGMFDEEKFLQALGDALHIDSSHSAYRSVTDVYFSDEDTGVADPDKVCWYVYFNGYETWKLLSTYYLDEDEYIFSEVAVQTEAPDTGDIAAENTGTSAGTAGSAGTRTDGSTTTTATTTSLDIYSVSTVFLAYVDSQEAFYQAIFDYVQGKGLTGSITSTMSGYEIDPDSKTATVRIMLSTGNTVTGLYNKTSQTYSFSGL